MKQIDGCTMGGPVSVALANIFMTKMENEIVSVASPCFYKRYVDDIYVRRPKDVQDNLFEELNNYHHNIKFTIEENPAKFLDTEILNGENGNIQTRVYQKPHSLPPNWSSKIPLIV